MTPMTIRSTFNGDSRCLIVRQQHYTHKKKEDATGVVWIVSHDLGAGEARGVTVASASERYNLYVGYW